MTTARAAVVLHCQHCGGPIPHHRNESTRNYLAKKYCGATCRNHGQTGRHHDPRPAAAVPLVDQDWVRHAACRHTGTDLFFHPDREQGSAATERDTAAKAVCAGCPVIDACAAYALTAGEEFGVWGGLTEIERAAMRQKGRGR